MNGSRRSFLGNGSKVGLAALLSGGLRLGVFAEKLSSQRVEADPSAPIPSSALGDPLFLITSAMFSNNLNSAFTFKLSGVELTNLTLVAVDDQTPADIKRTSASTRESFSLVFQGLRAVLLRQETYTVVHNKLGTFRLFIVPGDLSSRSAPRYRALINRLHPGV